MDDRQLGARRRSLARFALARADITAALQICELLLAQTHMPDHHDAFWPFHYAVVASYGRPFTDNKPLGALPATWGRFDQPRLQHIHDSVIELRHKTVAHSDLEHRPVIIIAKGTVLAEGIVAPSTMVSVVNKGLTNRESFMAIREVCAQHLVPKLDDAPARSSCRCCPRCSDQRAARRRARQAPHPPRWRSRATLAAAVD